MPVSVGLILSKKISKLPEEMPELGFKFSFTNTVTMDLINQNDIVLSDSVFDHILVESQYIKEYRMFFGMNKEYLQENGYPKYVESLKYHRFIYIADHYYNQICTPNMLKYINNDYCIENEIASYNAIQAGAGIGIVPEFLNENYPKIISFDLNEKLNNLKLYITYSKVKKNSYIEFMIDFLKRKL
jgi:DNA-binding transcriptional LysR family regulator